MKKQTNPNQTPKTRTPKTAKTTEIGKLQLNPLAEQEPAPALVSVMEGKINGIACQVVVARELHAFLESKQDYSNWLRSRIKKYGFAEKQDFEEFSIKLSKTSKGGRPIREYHLTLDMAKELSMVERTEKGREARRYFIDCERKLIESTPLRGNPASRPTAVSDPKKESGEVSSLQLVRRMRNRLVSLRQQQSFVTKSLIRALQEEFYGLRSFDALGAELIFDRLDKDLSLIIEELPQDSLDSLDSIQNFLPESN